ncbi:DUF3618 domain-containing protein [Streptacidiphilus carbonis]|uniref:DUF3618 domain-containing protein n=1 Tax=Streptacidiphilus carbonis TaxID=105422 RepID=UPI0005AAD172|nr:DUF3618 domain-containing protein [Streptacidiphilus carbonis]
MTDGPEDRKSTPTAQELQAMVEGTREELGETVQEIAARAHVRARAKDKSNQIKADLAESVAEAGTQVREGAAEVLHAVQENVADPVREKAASAAAAVQHGGSAVAAKVRENTPETVAAKADQAAEAVRRRPRAAIAAAVAAAAVLVALRRRRRR